VPSSTLQAVGVDPIFNFTMSKELKEEAKITFSEMMNPNIGNRSRTLTDFGQGTPENKLLWDFCEAIFMFLKKLNGSMFAGTAGQKYEVSNPAMVYAPPNSSRGTTHVDTTPHDRVVGYTAWIPISSVTDKNGCVTFFKGTCGQVFSSKRPPKYNKNSPSRKLIGSLGSIVLFDTRLHHRSEANNTATTRTVVTFLISLKSAKVELV
jgi:hypothetical protein